MTHLRSSTFALRATADRSSFGAARGASYRGVGRACLAAAATLRWRVAFTVVVLLGGGSSVFACPVCFGAEESSMIDGTKLGVLVMLGILFAVQGAFVAFFLYLRKRAKHIADIDFDSEWSELQRGSRTS